MLEDLGLADGLASLARSVAQLRVRVVTSDCRLPEHVEIALYRIAQESLQNVVKHAQATTATVHLHCDAGHAVLRVTDDGCGFDFGADHSEQAEHGAGTGAAEDSGTREASYGLRNMAERAELMGGRLEVTSRPGLGTTVTAVIPAQPKPLPDPAYRAGPGQPPRESPGVQRRSPTATTRPGSPMARALARWTASAPPRA